MERKIIENLILYIFIYTLSIGCSSDNVLNSESVEECESNCVVIAEAPDLEYDKNGYYHIEWLEGYTQTFTTLKADIGIEGYRRVNWNASLGIMYNGEFISCVNQHSYTSNNGIAQTTMGIWEGMIGDTITVYAEHVDWCGFINVDSIKVVVDNEI